MFTAGTFGTGVAIAGVGDGLGVGIGVGLGVGLPEAVATGEAATVVVAADVTDPTGEQRTAKLEATKAAATRIMATPSQNQFRSSL